MAKNVASRFDSASFRGFRNREARFMARMGKRACGKRCKRQRSRWAYGGWQRRSRWARPALLASGRCVRAFDAGRRRGRPARLPFADGIALRMLQVPPLLFFGLTAPFHGMKGVVALGHGGCCPPHPPRCAAPPLPRRKEVSHVVLDAPQLARVRPHVQREPRAAHPLRSHRPAQAQAGDREGYRYYSLKQLYLFDVIRFFVDTGMPSREIKEYLENRSIRATSRTRRSSRGCRSPSALCARGSATASCASRAAPTR